MPVTKSATKKLRVDRRRTKINLRMKRRYKQAVKSFFEDKTLPRLKRLYSLVDRAVKRHIIHKNKAARIKSRAARNLEPPKTSKPKK